MIKTVRLLRVAAPCMAAVIATACGGGGGGSPPPTPTTYTLSATAGTGGTIAPSSTTVNSGSTTTFTVTPNSGYAISGVTGCGGSLSGSTYTTAAATANCTVTASFAATYSVSATAGTGGNISPASATVVSGGTTMFTVTPATGYSTTSVTGCGGTLSGGTYTTGAITANCTVTASFSVSYGVSATAGSGGSISPTSTTVVAGGTTTFTLTPNGGYVINTVTGCGGSLSGNIYTTGTTNSNCTVTASFSPAFTWISGADTPDATGVYGTQGVAAVGNVPGARHGPVTWTDAAGNLWLFGGYGVGPPIFNDIWKYSPTSGEWTWVSGSNTPNAAGVFGTLGTAAATNTPGALGAAYSWKDASGNVWMFGGYGYDSAGNEGWLNALWEYSPVSGMWTWQAGPTTVNAIGVYGTKGVSAATNYPGARAAGGWTDSNGNVWIFGQYGYDSVGGLGRLNDLWEYSPSTHQWTWVGGSNTVNAPGVYGTQGVAAATNMPGARGAQAVWTDAAGNVWLFGGIGYDSTGTQGALDDLWKYSPSTGMWTWVNGPNTVNSNGVYGTTGVAAATNLPGARYSEAAAWVDSTGNLWMFGGVGYGITGYANELNDMWEYSPSSGQWTWVGGYPVITQPGIYGTQGVAASSNIPGSRDGSGSWTQGGFLWLFGGEGLNISGADPSAPEWNDLWNYPIQ